MKGVSESPFFFRRETVSIKAPIVPRKCFHTAGISASHTRMRKRQDSLIPYFHGLCFFFQNVDAIICPDAPIMFTAEHLTDDLDYELDLPWFLKKSGSTSPEHAREYIGGYVISNEGRALHHRREISAGLFTFGARASTRLCPLGPYIVTAYEIRGPAQSDHAASGRNEDPGRSRTPA